MDTSPQKAVLPSRLVLAWSNALKAAKPANSKPAST